MINFGTIVKVQEQEQDTFILMRFPNELLQQYIDDKKIKHAELRLDDGRIISSEQRKKIFATIRDISNWNGDFPKHIEEELKILHRANTGCEYFYLSDCSMDTAREFLDTIMEFVISNGIPLPEAGINRAGDINKYLYYCIKHKKCAVCGRPGEIHHVDAIGMGRDRRTVDDSSHRKLCLCRLHHTMAHSRGMSDFEKMYKVYGIKIN